MENDRGSLSHTEWNRKYHTKSPLKHIYNPLSAGNALNDIFRQIFNGFAKSVYDVFQRLEDLVSEPAFSYFFPHLLNRIHFRGIGRYVGDMDIGWYHQAV